MFEISLDGLMCKKIHYHFLVLIRHWFVYEFFISVGIQTSESTYSP